MYAGKHAGEEGVIEEIDEKNHRVKLKEGNKAINILTKQLMVTA